MNKLTFREKLIYGFGYLGMGLENSMVLSYLTLFATDVLYIKASIIGTVILLPKLLDILTDVMFVNIIDKTDTRWGKYRPWLISGIPLSICLFLLFLCPSFLTTPTQHLLWVTVIYFIMTPIFETLYWCPYLTLGSVISDDSEDRIKLASIRSVFEQISILAVSAVCIPTVLANGDSYHDPAGWRLIGAIFAVFGIVFTLICFFGIKERVTINGSSQQRKKSKLKENYSVFKNNVPLVRTVIIMVSLFIPWYGASTLVSYFCIYNLGHEEWIPILSVIGIFISTVTAAVIPYLTRKFERRVLISVGSILTAVSSIILIFSNGFISSIIYAFFNQIGLITIYVCSFSYMPDLSDYTFYKKGADATGLINAVTSAFQKIGMALGTFLGTAALSVGNYNPSTEVQSDFTLITIRWSIVLGSVICSAVIFFCNLNFRDFDKDNLKLYKNVP